MNANRGCHFEEKRTLIRKFSIYLKSLYYYISYTLLISLKSPSSNTHLIFSAGLSLMTAVSLPVQFTLIFMAVIIDNVGHTGAVVSVVDYGPRGPLFETWQRHSLFWPLASHIYPLLSTG